MKKTVLFFSLLLCLSFVYSVKAQTFVSTSPSNRNVVLEEFTGVYCQYCPDGHKKANQLATANPGRVVVLNIHQGGYANATPDYRTQWGDAIAGQTGLQGYPAGTVNRHPFTGTATALDRGNWATYAPQVMAEPSCVNVAAKSTIDWKTRTLTIVVEAYYTGNSGSAINMLNVAILQENVIGPQIGASQWYPEMMTPDGQYKHNHMLRDFVTGQWGDTISTTTQNHFFTKTYTYTIPGTIRNNPVNLENLNVAVFIAEGKQEIITGSMSTIEQVYSTEPSFRIDKIVQVPYTSTGSPCSDTLLQAKVYYTNTSQTNLTSGKVSYLVPGTNVTDTIYSITGKDLAFLSSDSIVLPPFKIIPNTVSNFTVTPLESNSANVTPRIPVYLSVMKYMVSTPKHGLILRLWQDQYGDETTWKLFDDNGNVVKQGGPYSRLGSATTKLHRIDLEVSQDACYRFEIYDKYGDGINAGSGSGKYEIWAKDNEGTDSTRIISSNGQFGYGERRLITTGKGIGIKNVNATMSDFFIYPNPVKDKAIVKLSLSNATTVSISVIDMLGKEVIKMNKTTYSKGEQEITIDAQSLKSGMYIVKIQTAEGMVSKRIIVTK